MLSSFGLKGTCCVVRCVPEGLPRIYETSEVGRLILPVHALEMLSFHVLCTSLSLQKWSPSPDSGPPPFSACQKVERSPLKAQLATRGESPLPSPRRDDRILTASMTGIFFCLCTSLHTSVISSLLPFLGSSTSLTVSRIRCRVRHAGAVQPGQACISIDVHGNSISRKRCTCTRLPMLGNQAGCPT
jgi:hypothetical protein